MTASVRPGWYVVLGKQDRLVVVEDVMGLPGAMRFRTVAHAISICERLNADLFGVRDFGPEGHRA